MNLPTLYKRTSTGALQEWTIFVEGARIFTRFGQTGGAIQETAPTICKGKNPGRSNATTGAEQAQMEAQAQWEKKLKKDYVKTQAEALTGATSELIEGGILPMLAHKFRDHGDKVVYPCFVQPKLDGHRCTSQTEPDGTVTLWSRTRKRITGVPHIAAAIQRLALPIHTRLDGELYAHSYHDKFEQLTHFIRQETPTAGHEVVEYHVFDVAMDGGLGFDKRRQILQKWMEYVGPSVTCLKVVETISVENEDELMLAFERFREQGYEGAIVRNAAGPYVNKRSYDLLKVKEFDDAEFEIVGVNEGKGKLAGHGIFTCKTPDGALFDAKMKGALADLAKYYQHPERYIGKQLTVQFQGFTKKNRVPRFPVAQRIRALAA